MFVCTYIQMSEVEEQMNNLYQFNAMERAAAWSCSCTMTTAVRTGICPPPHGTHFVPLILPLFPHVSKSVRDQMCFHSVLMFIFSRGVFWHLGYHMEDERWVALRGKLKWVCVFPSFSSLSCSEFKHCWIRSQLIAQHCTEIFNLSLFLTADTAIH